MGALPMIVVLQVMIGATMCWINNLMLNCHFSKNIFEIDLGCQLKELHLNSDKMTYILADLD